MEANERVMVLLIVVLSLQVLLMEQTAAITYRCDDDQILVVQSFGNDTIRMHCQKPTLCGYQFLVHFHSHYSVCGVAKIDYSSFKIFGNFKEVLNYRKKTVEKSSFVTSAKNNLHGLSVKEEAPVLWPNV